MRDKNWGQGETHSCTYSHDGITIHIRDVFHKIVFHKSNDVYLWNSLGWGDTFDKRND
jgi:hypothetical protein